MNKRIYFILICTLLLLSLINLQVGAKTITYRELIEILAGMHQSSIQHDIVVNSRLPRVLTTVLIGGALAVAGLLLQVITKNPLADAGILGINGSASLGVAVALIILPHVSFISITLFSCLFAAINLIFIFIFLINHPRQMDMRLILIGMVISLFSSALSTALSIYFNINKSVLFWSVGGTSGIKWQMVIISLPVILIGLGIVMLIARQLNLLSLSEDYVQSMGINLKVLYLFIFIVILLLSGVSVALAGGISFIGIIAPHFVRTFVKGSISQLIGPTILAGSCLVTLSDILSRVLLSPFIIPIGAILSLIGVPVFLYIGNKKVRV